MPVRASTAPLVSTATRGADVRGQAQRIKSSGTPHAIDIGDALNTITDRLNELQNAVRIAGTVQNPILVTDPTTGLLTAWIGDKAFNGIPRHGGGFIELYVGDAVGDRDPANAPLHATADGQVIIGLGGAVDVQDLYGNDVAWLGAQNDTSPVTGAVDNGTGSHLIRLTVTSTTLQTGDVVQVKNVGGVPNATGIFTVTLVDANHIDLQNSIFDGLYTSGGTVDRLLHITGAVNNGSGLIRLTITAHGYVDADTINVANVGGVPNATGQWIITVVDANTVDLRTSTFAGVYTSGGTSLRYFGGGLFQNIAIGPSFENYLLRAFPDGTLRLQNAEIIVDSNGITTTLNNQVYGGQVVGLTLQTNATPNQSATVFPKGFSLENAAGDFVGSFATSNSDPPGSGTFRLADGSGAGGLDGLGSTIFLTGVDGKVQCSQIQVSGGLGINKTIHGVDTSLGVNGLTLGTTTITYVTSINFVAQTYTTGSTTVVVSGSLSTADSIFTGGVVTS